MKNTNEIINFILEYICPKICYCCQAKLIKTKYFCKKCSLDKEIINLNKRLCHSCGSYQDNNLSVCSKCLPEEHSWKQGFTSTLYQKNSKNAIIQFKYHNQFILVKPFTEMILQPITPFTDKFDIITFVPKFWSNSLTTDYNQAKAIAQLLSKKIKKPFYTLLKKSKWTKKQAQLNKKKRLNNLKDAFKTKNKELIKDKSILLVDDVLTTGATLNACTKKMLQAGAQTIYILTIARG